jgi:hypothetical protein
MYLVNLAFYPAMQPTSDSDDETASYDSTGDYGR